MGWGRRLVLIALIAFLAAMGGVYAGRELFQTTRQSETELHALLHKQLRLDAAQATKIEAIEQRFATRRKALELEMRAANAHLAAAIEVPSTAMGRKSPPPSITPTRSWARCRRKRLSICLPCALS
jgi:hypothetical protein